MTEDTATQPDVQGFWRWFEDEADGLADVVSGQREANITELMDAALERFGLSLAYEVSAGRDGPELIFAAEGDSERAAFLQAMVTEAPTSKWAIHPQRPQRTLDEALAIVEAIYGVNLAEARFQVRVVDGKFHLRFLDDALFQASDDSREDVAALFLDYALGEAVATEAIGGLDFQPAGEGISMPLMVNELIRKAGDSQGAEPAAQ